jgi:hypothetical protein
MKKFSLKKKDESGKVGKPSLSLGKFSLKKNNKETIHKTNVFEDSTTGIIPPESVSTIQSNKDIAITSIDDVAVKKDPEVLVIVPPKLNKAKIRSFLTAHEKLSSDEDEEDAEAVLNREKLTVPMDSSPDEMGVTGEPPTSESYQRVPVGQFGFAMLRGMGWTEDSSKDSHAKKQTEFVGKPHVPLAGLGSRRAES